MKKESLCPDAPDRNALPGYADLEALALDMRWSWSNGADSLWQDLDPRLWELTHNPWVLLQTLSVESLSEKLYEISFQKRLSQLMEMKRQHDVAETWFDKKDSVKSIAYFSMEYMLSEALPIYSGGLGNVAGDQLKAASDLGIPVTAVGLLYQQGYFRQVVDKEGVQQALYPYNDPGQLPITPLRKENGEWLRLEIAFPGWSVWVRTWQVRVGRVRLLLLDSNDAANIPAYRAITSELYGGGSDLRLKQEILLGIVGWRLLETLNLAPEVCHLNEGHAAFAIIERARTFMEAKHCSFEEALAITRAGNLFTTHTAVPAGFDRFSATQIDQHMNHYISRLNLTLDAFMALGREHPDNKDEPFNMAYLAIRGSGAVNGVSRLHGRVSRDLFEPLFPHWSKEEIPVDYVTNGVHVPSWVSPYAADVWERIYPQEHCGLWTMCFDEKWMDKVSDMDLWHMRGKSRSGLIGYIRHRYARQIAAAGASEEEIEAAKLLFDENTLTMGFARRFATYKRPNMLLHDPERLAGILKNPRCPVQLIIAGKAHPADKPGQALIKQWVDFIRNYDAQGYVLFLSDYDMLLTEKMVEGVDVWINTPRRPWEACGTSGMKVLCNGGLNVSELDGWWVEAYNREVGWAIGDGQERGEDPAWDAAEAQALYRLLEEEVIPTFYERNDEGVSSDWVAKVRASMGRLTPVFSANRTVREYTEKFYIPAAASLAARLEKGEAILSWKRQLHEHWSKMRFSGIKIITEGDKHLFEIQVYLDGISPEAVQVQVYADPTEIHPLFIQVARQERALEGTPGTYIYRAEVPADRSASQYTPRIIPYFTGIAVPLEENHILWQNPT